VGSLFAPAAGCLRCVTAAGWLGSKRVPFCSLRQGERGRQRRGEEVGEKARERDQKRREAEAGIYHVVACSPSPPGAQPRNALPKTYFLICDVLSDIRASPLLPSF